MRAIRIAAILICLIVGAFIVARLSGVLAIRVDLPADPHPLKQSELPSIAWLAVPLAALIIVAVAAVDLVVRLVRAVRSR